jgi:pathogenesis-related protein 1
VPGLKWSVELAEYAQEWANYLAYNYNCNIQHRRPLKKQTRKDTGENIFWGGGKSYTSLDASKSWYSEIEQYTYRKITNQNYYNTGHYTQMIWKNTKYVGIGIAICPDGNTIVVGNYSPPGNYTGQYPY